MMSVQNRKIWYQDCATLNAMIRTRESNSVGNKNSNQIRVIMVNRTSTKTRDRGYFVWEKKVLKRVDWEQRIGKSNWLYKVRSGKKMGQMYFVDSYGWRRDFSKRCVRRKRRKWINEPSGRGRVWLMEKMEEEKREGKEEKGRSREEERAMESARYLEACAALWLVCALKSLTKPDILVLAGQAILILSC